MDIELVHFFDATVTLDPPVDIGQTPQGIRQIININGGTVEGERINGTILNSGADWRLIKEDGSAFLDTRYAMETDDGAVIYIQNIGFRHGPPAVLEKLAKGEDADPNSYYFRSAPVLETATKNKKYAWVNHTIFLATGARLADAVKLTVYEVK